MKRKRTFMAGFIGLAFAVTVQAQNANRQNDRNTGTQNSSSQNSRNTGPQNIEAQNAKPAAEMKSFKGRLSNSEAVYPELIVGRQTYALKNVSHQELKRIGIEAGDEVTIEGTEEIERQGNIDIRHLEALRIINASGREIKFNASLPPAPQPAARPRPNFAK